MNDTTVPQSSPVAIRADNVTLALPLARNAMGKGNALLPAQVGGRLSRDPRHSLSVIALDGLTFEIKRGDRVGLVGRNGAGKTSLLRVLAGIYRPTSGTCIVRGKVSTLFTASLGINRNATGLENIFLMGTFLGLSRKELDALVPEIIEFSELGEFLHLPLRTYSAGMTTRLGFAVATSLNPDILLIDEVFGAGDREFQAKAKERILSVMSEANTLVLASHSEPIIQQFCSRTLWLDHGRIRAIGDTESVLQAYRDATTVKSRATLSRAAPVRLG